MIFRLILITIYTAPIAWIYFTLTGHGDFAFLPINSSEKFWIYISEYKLNQGLLNWPDTNVNLTNSLYLERLIPRSLTWLSISTLQFIALDLTLSLGIMFSLLIWARKKFIHGEIAIYIMLLSPLYLFKLTLLEGVVIELWFARNLTAVLALSVFIYFLYELIDQKNIFRASLLILVIGFIHTYTFLLSISTLVTTLIWWKFKSQKLKRPKVFIIFPIIFIFFVLINCYFLRKESDLLFFWMRYTPSDNDLFTHNLFYYSLFLIFGYVFNLIAKTPLTKFSSFILIITTISAISFDAILYLIDHKVINIHFRIYIIEHIFIFATTAVFMQYFINFKNIYVTISTAIVIGFLCIGIINVKKVNNDNKYPSIHKTILKDNFITCNCSVYSPNAEKYYDKYIKNQYPYFKNQQWYNSTYHLKSND